MSNYLAASVTIKVSDDFEWLDTFINAIYKKGKLAVHPFDQPRSWNGMLPLEQAEARGYFKRYIEQIQKSEDFLDLPPFMLWIVEDIGYDVSIGSKLGYLRWTMHFTSNRRYKKSEKCFTDYQYYILLLLETMKDFHILEVDTYDDSVDYEEWYKIDGKRWRFKLQQQQSKYNFQMLDVVVYTQSIADFINDLKKATAHKGYSFAPINTTLSEAVLYNSIDKESFFQEWRYSCGDEAVYVVHIQPFSSGAYVRLLFKTLMKKNNPQISLLIEHAFTLTENNFLEQVRSFDSRYNDLI